MANGLLNKRYGRGFKEHLIEQYKLYVATAEEVARKRQAANTFYLSINSAIIAVSGYLSFQGNIPTTILLSITGIITSHFWGKTIKSYKQLNSGKYKVICQLEQELPAKLFDYEWKCLGEGKAKNYAKLTEVEGKVPLVFKLLYVGILVVTVVIALFPLIKNVNL